MGWWNKLIRDYITDYPKVTRVEVISNGRDYAREYVKYNVRNVQITEQDGGRTLKIFLDHDTNNE